MANYACYPMDEHVPSHLISHVTAPAGGLKPGQVVALTALDTTISGNFTQYVATQPTTANMKTSLFGIVINGGFEKLADNRRPAGQPDFTQYSYLAGETVPVIVLQPGVTVYVSDDCFASAPTVGQFASPANGSNTLVMDAARGSSLANLLALAKKPFRLGGLFGAQFATGTVFRVAPTVVITA